MNNVDSEYFKLLRLVLDKGKRKKNRTGIDTFGVFGAQSRFDLNDGFPLLTTKKVAFRSIVHELLWFLSGSTNIKYLVDNNVNIWNGNAYDRYKKGDFLFGPLSQEEYIEKIKIDNEFAKNYGDLGRGTYSSMWRAFPYFEEKSRETFDFSSNPYTQHWKEFGVVDQIQKILDKLKSNPNDRRLIVSAWHPYWVDHCALPPCHCLFQFHTEELNYIERITLLFKMPESESLPEIAIAAGNENDERDQGNALCDRFNVPKRRINCQLYQRSCDLFLGVPFNIASYSLLLSMVAHVSNMIPGEFVHTFGDLHLYENHLDQARLQLAREPRPLPKLKLNKNITNLFDFKFEDISLENYDPHPAIKAKMAV